MKPKLLIASDSFLPRVDGVASFLHNLLPSLVDTFEITVIAPDFPGKYSTLLPLHIIRIPIHHFTIGDYPPPKTAFRKVKKAVQAADIVFSQTIGPIGGLSIRYARKLNKKVVSYIHSVEWELVAKSLSHHPLVERLAHTLVPKVARYLYNRSDLLLIPYRKLEEELRHKGIYQPMAVVRLGVNLERFTPPADKKEAKRKAGVSPDSFVIGFMGRVSREKNVALLLRAFKRLPSEKVSLLIVGDGLESMVGEFRTLHNCKVTGFIDDVVPFLQAMDVFVMPSLTETTSLATIEAMAVGLPVVVTKVGYMQEYVIKDHNGVFFPRNSAAILAMKLEKMRTSPEFRAVLSGNARRTVVHSFPWEQTVAKIKKALLQ